MRECQRIDQWGLRYPLTLEDFFIQLEWVGRQSPELANALSELSILTNQTDAQTMLDRLQQSHGVLN